jgi:hypothetical protein
MLADIIEQEAESAETRRKISAEAEASREAYRVEMVEQHKFRRERDAAHCRAMGYSAEKTANWLNHVHPPP